MKETKRSFTETSVGDDPPDARVEYTECERTRRKERRAEDSSTVDSTIFLDSSMTSRPGPDGENSRLTWVPSNSP